MQQVSVLWAYLIYLPIALWLTIFVTGKLFGNAIVYMMDIFHDRKQIAVATNQLFKIGFYLINMGFALYILRINQDELTTKTIFEVLSTKIGGFSIYLGIMLLFNMFLFFRGRKAARKA
ncbi:hypothetical protein GCM10027566_30800 [Arachidicoccus ginsenosidivorans]|jgi:hypothetical protein|uniref:Integral membrane protein n=1 Tax=Arachidicoccus ginsenosidivorans TaxID=496057 RepID=A0A5B8VHE4_9BACT|nr:hypothetical protein [Arachidicoccus ginsenosidivorans]QEC70593.1 hypothetical protein FSB73_01635 [Arachidicoccus ginsenosidivorans]